MNFEQLPKQVVLLIFRLIPLIERLSSLSFVNKLRKNWCQDEYLFVEFDAEKDLVQTTLGKRALEGTCF